MIPPSPIGSKFEEPADTMPSVAAVVTAAPSIVMIVAMRSIAVTVRLLVVTLPVALTISTFAQRKIPSHYLPQVHSRRRLCGTIGNTS